MDGNSQKGRLSSNMTKGRTSDGARRAGKRVRTLKEASNDTNFKPREEEKVTVPFVKLQVAKLIDAVSKGLQSSSRRPAQSSGKITSGPINAPEKAPTPFTELSKHQLARIFDPLVATVSILSSRKGVSRVSYGTVRSMMAYRTQEMKSIGWASFEQILKIACHARVIQIIRIGWNDKFLKLLLPLVEQKRIGSGTAKRLKLTEYSSKHDVLMGARLHPTGRRSVALSKLDEDEYDAALSTASYTSDVPCAYFNLQTVSSAPKVPQAGSVPIRSPSPPRRNAQQSASKPPKKQHSEKALTSWKSGPVSSQSVLPPTQLGTPTQPASQSTRTPLVPPTARTTSNNVKYTALSFPLKHRAVVSILIRLTDGTCEEKVRVEDVIGSLKVEYRGAREGFLHSLIVKADEEGVVGRERDQGGVDWTWMRNPSRLNIVPPAKVKQYDKLNRTDLMKQKTKPMTKIHAEPSSPQPFRDEIPNPAARNFIIATIPYGEPRYGGGHAVRKDVNGSRPSKAKPFRAEARRGALTLALKSRLISILSGLTKGLPGGKARVDELTRLLKQENPRAQEGSLLSIIREAEGENLLILERDWKGLEWARLRRPDTPGTVPSVKSAKNLERTAPGEPKLVRPNRKPHLLWNPTAPHPLIQLPLGNVNVEAGTLKVPSTLEQTQVLAKFEPLVACISRLRGNKPESKVSYNAVKRALASGKEKIENLGWPSVGMLMDAAYKAGVVEPIRMNSTAKLEYLRLIPQPLRPLHSEAMSTLLEQQQFTLEEFPRKCRAVASTMLRLTGGVVGTKVCMTGLATSLAHEFPSSRGPWYQISQAEEQGILRKEIDDVGVTWARIENPRPPLVMSPQADTAAAAVSIGTTPPPLQTSTRTAPTKINASICPPKHRAVVASLITLADGTPGKKVLMDAWISSLRGEYPGAREEFLLYLIAKAEEDGVVTRRRSQDGVEWAWLNPEKDIQTVPVPLDSRLEPERHEVPASPTADDYPVAHRAVVSVIQSMNGSVHTQVSLGTVCWALCNRKYASTSQGAMNMITAARSAKIIRVSGKQILLEEPGLSRGGALSARVEADYVSSMYVNYA